jgi:hypothetical protein
MLKLKLKNTAPPQTGEYIVIKPKADGKRKKPDYLYLTFCLYQLLEAG